MGFLEDHPMNIPTKFGSAALKCTSTFCTRFAFYNKMKNKINVVPIFFILQEIRVNFFS